MKKFRTISLGDLLENAQTGDILICSGNIMQTSDSQLKLSIHKRIWDGFCKYVQKGLTGPWTHVGLIIRDRDDIYLLEAVSNDIYKYDLITRKPCTKGMRLIKLYDKVIDYNGVCAWQPLYRNKDLPSLKYMKETLFPVLYSKKFKVRITDMIKTIFMGPSFAMLPKEGPSFSAFPKEGPSFAMLPKEDPSFTNESNILDKVYIMCSETLYYLYCKLGIVTGKYQASQIFPHMYAEKFIDLKDSFDLGDPIIISY